jgi:nitroreductase
MTVIVSDWKEQARSMIGRAVLAPSSHNTQPWFFQLSDSAVDLFADRTRALPANDPEDRELAISCGCALMNLRIGAASAGLHVQVQLLPKPEEPDLLARISLSGQSDVSADDAPLADFIETRRTYRKRFAPREVSASALDQLIEATRQEGARLVPLLTEEVRQKAAALVAEGDAAQWANPSWRRELAAWMHPRRRGDGLIMPALAVPLAQLVVRTFDMGGGVGAKDRQLAEASPLLAVLSTESDHPRDWLLAGQALQRALLIGCKHGLQASYLNQPVQVGSLRPKLQDLVGTGFPQILLRIGYPLEEISPAPRRALDDVLE